MTRFEHTGWYCTVIASMYNIDGQVWWAALFAVAALLGFILGHFERKQ